MELDDKSDPLTDGPTATKPTDAENSQNVSKTPEDSNPKTVRTESRRHSASGDNSSATQDALDNSLDDQNSRPPPSSSSSSLTSPSSSSSLSTDNKKDKERRKSKENNVKEEDEIFFKDEDNNPDPTGIYGYSGTFGYLDRNYWGGGGFHPHQHALSADRRKIVQDILASFDLEQVMDRYRGDTVSKSLRGRQVELWAEEMMGSQHTPNSDREWAEQLKERVMQDFEKRQDEKEKRLEDAESQRLLKLKILGILRDEEEEEARRLRGEKKKTPAERTFERRNNRKHRSLFKPQDIETQMEILNRDESEVKRRNEKQADDVDDVDHNSSRGDLEDDRSSYAQTYRGHLGRTEADKKKDIHPNLKQFYEEEDLQNLYIEAEKLVKCPSPRK